MDNQAAGDTVKPDLCDGNTIRKTCSLGKTTFLLSDPFKKNCEGSGWQKR